MAENNVPAASLRFLLLGDVGVGKSTFISTLASTLSAVHANDLIEEYIPAPLSSSTPAPSAIRLNGVHIGAGSVLQDDGSSPFDDPLGLLPPKVEVPSRDLTFLSLPGYSSTTNPSTILSLTDDYLNHHLHSVTSIFSPSIPSAQLAWFLIAGSGAHSLPTCAFYFVLYELKPIDIIYMKMIHERINLIPIIAKADTVSKNELWVLKKRMLRQLKMNGIKIHTFGLDMETIEKMTQQRQWGAPPFVVSTREDSEGQLLESELKLLIDLCLYKRIRHLQEDAARKVIAWKRTIEQTGRQTKTNVEKVWERGVANTKDTKTNHANGFTTNTTPVAAVATVNASTFVNNHSNGSYFTQADMLPSVSSPVNQIIPGQYAPPPSVQQQQQQVLTPPTPAPQINGQLASPINLPFTPPPSGNSSSLDKTDVSTNFGLSLTGYAPPPSFNNGATTGYSAPPSSFNKPASLGAVSSAYPVPGTAAVIPPPPSSSHAHPSQYTATTIYSPLPKTTSANSVVNAITPPIQSRLPLGHTVTGLSVDNSTRPTELTGENVQETVPDARRSFMESYTPKATGAADGVHSSPTLEAASSASAGAEDRIEVKVEIPNSGSSYQPSAQDSITDFSKQLPPTPQLQQTSFLLPGGFQPAGAFLIPPHDLYQATLMPTVIGAAGTNEYGEAYPDIWEAVELGDVATVQMHLNNGVSPDLRNTTRSTLLHRTAWQGVKPFAVMKLLISYGANVNLTNENGNTVLQNVLMKHDDVGLVKLLLDNGAETMIPNKEGMNALEVTALFNKVELARYLLENDLSSSEPQSIINAMQRVRSPDKRAMRVLLKSWQGKDGEKKRLELMERLRNPPSSHGSHQSQQHSQHQQQRSSDAASVRSFETTKGDGKSSKWLKLKF